MAKIEREYNIPLRQAFLKVPSYKKSKKAMTALKEFLVKHMKSENVKIGNHLNELIWKDGIKNPPHHVNVIVIKDDDGKVFAELKKLPKTKISSVEKKRDSKAQKKEASKKKIDLIKEAAQKAKEAPKKDVKIETKVEKSDVSKIEKKVSTKEDAKTKQPNAKKSDAKKSKE